jgi:organic hydroperoxide reductase OsmC/OhrA
MSKHEYTATIVWQRAHNVKFTDQRYSRAHEWRFDGGVVVPASSSPNVVPVPLSAGNAVDPEEAFVAALSSCHMLFFLFHAAKKGFVIDRYEDRAVGTMGKNTRGATAMLRVALRPHISWDPPAGDSVGLVKEPTPQELHALHEAAHQDCYIANSVTTEVVIEPA